LLGDGAAVIGKQGAFVGQAALIVGDPAVQSRDERRVVLPCELLHLIDGHRWAGVVTLAVGLQHVPRAPSAQVPSRLTHGNEL
jgi:hypothetical protein